MAAITRVLRFALFTLLEYIRSGRIVVEFLATIVLYYVFFRSTSTSMTPDVFFSIAGFLLMLIAGYSTAMLMSMSDRAQGYLILTRRVGRTGYIAGFYLAALAVAAMAYGILSLFMAVFSPADGLTLQGWVLGSIPLLLNLAVTAATITLLAPAVLSGGGRLAVLGAIALAFSGSVFNSQAFRSAAPLVRSLIDTVQLVCSAPLLPVFTGYALSVSREYAPASIAILLAQFSLACGLLSLAFYAFARREIMLEG